MLLFDLESLLDTEDDRSNDFLESYFSSYDRSDDECAIAESPDVSETIAESLEVSETFTKVVGKDKWSYNRKQAVNRFLSGRKLSARTKEKYGLTDNLLSIMHPFVDCQKKYKYDRNAHMRRRRRGAKLSIAMQKRYDIPDVEEKKHVDDAKETSLKQSMLPFKKRRSSRPRRPNERYLKA